jgi:ribonuclease HI
MKHKLHDRCSNNQAEQMTIIKALQEIETIKINNNTPRTVMIHTDSRITTLKKQEKWTSPNRRN